MPARLEEEIEYEGTAPASVAPKEPQKRLVPPPPPLFGKPKVARRFRGRASKVFLVLTACAMLITVRSGIGANNGYELVKLQQEVRKVEQENQRLRIEISHLKAPKRIRDIATKELGMEVPKKVYFSQELP